MFLSCYHEVLLQYIYIYNYIFKKDSQQQKMDNLKQIIQNKQRQKDPTWQSLYNTDIRNLFPKYQLAKIDKAKTKYDKFRLIMQNIQDFVCLQKHRKETKKIVQQIDDIKNQLQELIELEKNQQDGQHQYHNNVLSQRDNAEIISQQLNKYGQQIMGKVGHRNQLLAFAIKNNKNWQKYYNSNCLKPQTVSQQHNFVQKLQLSQTVQIPSSSQTSIQILNQSTSSQVLLARRKKMEINKKLKQKWLTDKDKIKENEPIESINLQQQFMADWKNVTKDIDYAMFV